MMMKTKYMKLIEGLNEMFSPFEVENIFTRKRNIYVVSQNGKSHPVKRKIDRRNVEVIF